MESELKDIFTKYADEDHDIKPAHRLLGDVLGLAGCTPADVGESKDWVGIVRGAKQDRIHLCKALH